MHSYTDTSSSLYFAIAMYMPTVIRFTNKKEITEQQYTNITFIVKRWFANEWKRAVLSATTDLPWQQVALRQYAGTEWETCHANVFALMKMPPKQTYATYEKLVDLDGAIYQFLNPFLQHLEFPKEVLAENEARARKPLPAHMQHILKQFEM